MGIVLGAAAIIVTFAVCGWVAFTDPVGSTSHRVSFWVIMACGLSLGVLMIAAHFLGWGW